MVVVDAESFLTRLQNLYMRTRKRGTVRVQISRMFTENFHHKKSKHIERRDDKLAQSKAAGATFALCVKAAALDKQMSC